MGLPTLVPQGDSTSWLDNLEDCPSEYDGTTINSTTSLYAYGKAGEGGFPSICWGDSGGPLYNAEGHVIGLTSWCPDACTDLATPFNIFTCVTYYKKTLIDRIANSYDR
jgi:secreted trypsin-like serine protease